jgi:Protein of unknown function (DUF3592)
MAILILFLFRRRPENGMFDLLYGGVVLTFLAGSVLWDRRYRRRWQNDRSRNWKRIDGRFDEGEIITMRKARSKSIAGYEVWLGYDYEAEGEQVGVFRLPRKSKDDADAALSTLAHQRIVVRVDPDNPDRSFVSDDDLIALLPVGRPPE